MPRERVGTEDSQFFEKDTSCDLDSERVETTTEHGILGPFTSPTPSECMETTTTEAAK